MSMILEIICDDSNGGDVYTVDKITELIRCKDCKHRMVNAHIGEKHYGSIKAWCDLDTGDEFQLGRRAENDDWFCADGER